MLPANRKILTLVFATLQSCLLFVSRLLSGRGLGLLVAGLAKGGVLVQIFNVLLWGSCLHFQEALPLFSLIFFMI